MIFFYKLKDFIKDEIGQWLFKVCFTISDIIEGCHGPVSIYLCEIDEPIINKHRHQYEYFTTVKSIQPLLLLRLIFDESDVNNGIDHVTYPLKRETIGRIMDELNRIISSYSKQDINNKYIHITCNKNIAGIRSRGLLNPDFNQELIQIGDRGSVMKAASSSDSAAAASVVASVTGASDSTIPKSKPKKKINITFDFGGK
jgi:hypothetical protein